MLVIQAGLGPISTVAAMPLPMRPIQAIVVDTNSGKVLDAVNQFHCTWDDNCTGAKPSPRHPASLAKITTLYVLFEQLNAGKRRRERRRL